MKPLYVMDIDFKVKGIISAYTNYSITRNWCGIDVIELYINSNIPYTEFLIIDNIIWLGKDYHKAGIIEYVQEDNKGNLQIKAKGLQTFLQDRITIPPAGSTHDEQTGNRETVIKAWVNNNMINPTDSTRNFNIVNAIDTNLGDSITEQTRYKKLYEEIIRVLSVQKLGFKISIDLVNSRFEFDVVQGIDKNSSVYFKTEFGNISDEIITKNSMSEVNFAYVGGQGEGSNRTIQLVDNSSGKRRKEIFVDARDISTVDGLTEKGTQELVDVVESFDCSVLQTQYTYEIDYDLGDYVNVEGVKRQIVSVKEVYQSRNISVEPTFGNSCKTLTKQINSLDKRITDLETI